MRTARTHTLSLIVALLALVAVLEVNWRALAAHPQHRQLNRVYTGQDISPSLALVTFALGPMRGLIADVLWWRAIQMQDRGDFFEAIQLADWISKLQPTMAMVWAYHGWNMASNIVNEVEEPAERWKWIEQGIKLMRDEGLSYNPGDPVIRRELASIFHFRIGGVIDKQHQYYRRQWIATMQKYLDRGDAEEIKAIEAAPATVEELRAAPGVAALVDAAAAEQLDLLDFRQFSQRDKWTDAQRSLVAAPANKDALETIRLYHSKVRLPLDLRLDPARMLLLDEHYGPFDWRLWQAQTVYWAANDGLPGHDDEPYGSGAFENTFIQQAMVSSFREGRLVYMSDDLLMLTNNLDIIANVDGFLHHMEHENPKLDPGTLSLFRDFHESASVILFTYGYSKQSHEMYEAFRDKFMTEEQKANTNYEVFIANNMVKVIGSRRKDAYSLVQSSLYQAYIWLALGDSYKAKGYDTFARMIHSRNNELFGDNPAKRLPPIGEIRRTALDLAIGPTSTIPPELQAILRKLKGDGADIPIKATGARPEIRLENHEDEGHHE